MRLTNSCLIAGFPEATCTINWRELFVGVEGILTKAKTHREANPNSRKQATQAVALCRPGCNEGETIVVRFRTSLEDGTWFKDLSAAERGRMIEELHTSS